jgi:hypothetical protein
MSETKQNKEWRDIAAAWINENDRGEYLSIKFETDISFKAGDYFSIGKNKFKEEGSKQPDYKKSDKIEEAPVVKPISEKGDELPF